MIRGTSGETLSHCNRNDVIISFCSPSPLHVSSPRMHLEWALFVGLSWLRGEPWIPEQKKKKKISTPPSVRKAPRFITPHCYGNLCLCACECVHERLLYAKHNRPVLLTASSALAALPPSSSSTPPSSKPRVWIRQEVIRVESHHSSSNCWRCSFLQIGVV